MGTYRILIWGVSIHFFHELRVIVPNGNSTNDTPNEKSRDVTRASLHCTTPYCHKSANLGGRIQRALGDTESYAYLDCPLSPKFVVRPLPRFRECKKEEKNQGAYHPAPAAPKKHPPEMECEYENRAKGPNRIPLKVDATAPLMLGLSPGIKRIKSSG